MKPKLLFLCHSLPYPPNGGGWIRSFNLLKQLSRSFDVTLLSFERTGGREHDAKSAASHLAKYARTEVLPVPQEESVVRFLTDHLRSLVRGRVHTVYKHQSRRFQGRLESCLERESFQIVHADSLDLSTYFPLLVEELPVVCGHHNVESQLLRRRAEAESGFFIRRYLAYQSILQEREERRWCDRVGLNVTVSEEDRSVLRKLVPGARVSVVPNGVDVDFFVPQGSPTEGVLFLGPGGWFPNRDGMEYFCRKILPQLRRQAGGVSVRWVGTAPSALRRQMEEQFGVEMVGYVEDVRPYLAGASCCVVPLRVGGGSRLKILDAWAMGKAVVSTSRGCEGLAARDGVNLLIRDDAQSFAEAVARVLGDSELRRGLGRNGRNLVERRYDWDVIGEKLCGIYLGELERHGKSSVTGPEGAVSGSQDVR